MANWIVVCGLLRDELEFRLTLAQIAELRSEGLVDGVVLSTWLGETDTIPGLRAELSRTGIDLVESASPPPSTGNSWAQNKATYQGLAAVPEGANVFRMRTDRTAHLFKLFRPALISGPPKATSYGLLRPIFKKKICAQAVAASVPFYAADFAYYGLREDLMKMVTFDGVFDVQFRGFGAEQRLWAGPFFKAFPRLARYFEHIDILALSNQAVRAVQAGRDLPDEIWALYAFSWANIWNNIHIVEMRGEGEHPVTPQRLLGSEPSWGVRIGTIASHYPVRLSTFNSPLGVKSLMDNALKKIDPNGAAVSKAFQRIKWRGSAALAPYTDGLADRIVESEDPNQPTSLLVPFSVKRAEASSSNGAGFSETLNTAEFANALARNFDMELDERSLEIVREVVPRIRDGINMGWLYRDVAKRLLEQALKDGSNTTLAGNFYLRGAERGDVEAAGMFSQMAYEGMIADYDPAKLIRWAKTAAIKGDPRATHVMAKLFEEDRLPKDLVEDGRTYHKRMVAKEFEVAPLRLSQQA